jgi:hypothetical protein
MSKKTEYRNGQKHEIGFDLKKDHAGQDNGTSLTTEQGELFSNFMENGDYLSTNPKNQ